ncbi:MAG: hypothetical protein NVSMB55_00590 [Mycobacteriales bacterium]
MEALAEARAASDLLRDARLQVRMWAERRRRAVLDANRGGASYGTIAASLGVSHASVQQLVNQATQREPLL